MSGVLVDGDNHTGEFIATIDCNGSLYRATDPLIDSNFEVISSTYVESDNLEYFVKHQVHGI